MDYKALAAIADEYVLAAYKSGNPLSATIYEAISNVLKTAAARTRPTDEVKK